LRVFGGELCVTALLQVNMSAKFPEDRLKNLKILQKVIALPCELQPRHRLFKP
jgi:hypothetical protein